MWSNISNYKTVNYFKFKDDDDDWICALPFLQRVRVASLVAPSLFMSSEEASEID